jgi:hypothetical protein
VAEGNVATINVTRTGGTGAASISYTTLDGSASSAGTAGDYTSAAGLLNFAAGQTTASFTVPALTDSILESPETVNLVLFGGNVSNPSILTINDVPPPPTPTSPSFFQFAQPNYTVPEGGVATINVIRTGGTGAASINYATLDGTASSAGNPPDYTSTAGLLNFAAGQTTASFTVTALSDLIVESPETVNLVLLGGNVGSNPSILTINDVPPPTRHFFSLGNYSVAEGNTVPITINRTGDLSQPSAIFFGTTDGTAKSTAVPPDYTSVFTQINFASGQSSVQVEVKTSSDALTENTESVILFLSGESLASPFLSLLSIIDGPPVIAQGPLVNAPTPFFFASSGDPIIDGGSGDFTTINPTGNTSVSPSVDYLIVASGLGQPVNNVDYNISPLAVNPSGGTVNFNPGQTPVSLTINNLPDLTGGVVNSGFGPGTNAGTPPSTAITLI